MPADHAPAWALPARRTRTDMTTTWISRPEHPRPARATPTSSRSRASRRTTPRSAPDAPSSLLYTYGPGAIMDLPHFTVMPSGLDDWDRIWKRRDGIPQHPRAPAARGRPYATRAPGRRAAALPAPARRSAFSDEGRDLGVPAIVFPQWLRCTGCNLLAPLSPFEYRNTHPFRPDEARFEHVGCPGFGTGNKGGGKRRSLALPARYLLACTNGHLDEFPYEPWVHRGGTVPQDAEVPAPEDAREHGGRGRVRDHRVRLVRLPSVA